LLRQRVGAGEPLVLLHGLGESTLGWHPVLGALSGAYDVILLDLPGFGRSPALATGVLPTASALADAVEAELDALGVDSFHVAGYSLGARVAFELATRGRVLSVLAIAPDGLGTPAERVYQAVALMTGRIVATMMAPFAGPLTSTGAGRSLFFAGERSRPWRLRAQDSRQLLLDFAQAPAYTSAVLATVVDVPTGLARITCPVLILQGTADPLVSVQSPRYLALVPHATWRWLPGLSHVPISDDPQQVARLMLSFLESPAGGESDPSTAGERRQAAAVMVGDRRAP
jgi:pimeloyl-ACP methyl ester carboxylesterase